MFDFEVTRVCKACRNIFHGRYCNHCGEKVTEPGEVAPAIQRGLDAVVRQGCPAVLDVWLPKHVTNETPPPGAR